MIEYCTPDNELIEEVTNIQPDVKDTDLTVTYKANTETKEKKATRFLGRFIMSMKMAAKRQKVIRKL